MTYTLHHGDCLEVLATLPDCLVDAIVTDPPAGIAFMGKAWDRDKGGKAEWVQWMQSVAAQCLRVIKPGGHALVWAIPRTSHWTGDAWEEAGWQVRDKIYHVFGSGFPKSMDVSKQLDRMAGVEREVVGERKLTGKARILSGSDFNGGYKEHYRGSPHDYKEVYSVTAPATPEAKQWAGWGTALKPAAEEWWLFRRPLEGTVAANVLKHGTGAINVDGCRIESGGEHMVKGIVTRCTTVAGDERTVSAAGMYAASASFAPTNHPGGRWPANFTHDGSDEVMALFPDADGAKSNGRKGENGYSGGWGSADQIPGYADSGSAARFFYCAKASKADRDEGCEGMELREAGIKNDSGRGFSESDPMAKIMRSNHHPTVKPVDLMTYLCRLITPPRGTILDPFTGSGSTGKAAILEDFHFIGIEREAEYIEIARARIDAAIKFRSEFLF